APRREPTASTFNKAGALGNAIFFVLSGTKNRKDDHGQEIPPPDAGPDDIHDGDADVRHHVGDRDGTDARMACRVAETIADRLADRLRADAWHEPHRARDRLSSPPASAGLNG